jgi:GTP cyclohydrolase I
MNTMALRNVVSALLHCLEEDERREGLNKTPDRVAKAWETWTSGYNQSPADILTTFSDGAENYDEMVFLGGIQVYSTCEHHMVPFFGVAHVGYIPNGRIVGLSKLPRLVEVFARRLTVQERICAQTADALMLHLQPVGVGVVLQCRHLCMESRGIQKPGTITVTSALRGCIKEHHGARAEFLTMVQTASQGLRSL